MIRYTNILYHEYEGLSDDEKKENSYCIEYSDGGKDWKVNGLYHHEDGPAVIYSNIYSYDTSGENKFWYLNNIQYSFKEWCKILNKSDEEIIFLRLKYL